MFEASVRISSLFGACFAPTVGLVFSALLGCSAEGATVTNVPFVIDGGSSGGSGSGGGGQGGTSGTAGASAGFGGVGGSQGGTSAGGAGGGSCAPGDVVDVGPCAQCGTFRSVCQSDGSLSVATCQDQGECMAGATEEESCGSCGGMRSRACGDECAWEPWGDCSEPADACAPGATRPGSCDPCSEEVCQDDCTWGSCELKATSECEHQGGSNWRCCAAGSWQFCLSSCAWSTACAAGAPCCTGPGPRCLYVSPQE